MSRTRARQRQRPAPRKLSPGRARPRTGLAVTLVVVLLVLGATAEERMFGTASDEKQILATAVSMVECGELGIARWYAFTVPRAGGDAVSPYGVGLPLLEAVPALLAGPWERWLGPGSSQTLFVMLQILLVGAAAACSGLLAHAFGAPASGVNLAVVATALASPLWAYAASGYSEPLQAAALAGSLLLSIHAARAERAGVRTWLAAGAGALAGYAVLTKSTNLLLVPLLLAPLVLDQPQARSGRERLRTVAAGAATAALVLALWLAVEMQRFGHPFSSYGDQRFSHPLLDGLWRLTVGPNVGLALFFPLLLLAPLGAVRLARSSGQRGSLLALVGAPLYLLVISAAWWAFDGTCGWGPRLLVPAVPLLAALSGLASAASHRTLVAAVLLGAAGLAVNLLGALQPETSSSTYLAATPLVPVTGRLAAEIPRGFSQMGPDGQLNTPRYMVAARDPAFSEIRTHLFLLRNRIAASSSVELVRRLAVPPWATSHPEAVPQLERSPLAGNPAFQHLLTPFAWPHVGSSLAAARRRGSSVAWQDAQVNQIVRAFDLGRPERALPLADRLFDISGAPPAAAFKLEALRLMDRRQEMASFSSTLSPAVLASPVVQLVQALSFRDLGDEAAARAALAASLRAMPGPVALKAASEPLSAWPGQLSAYLPRSTVS